MKTVRIINKLKDLAENPKGLMLKDCTSLLRLAAERLEELSTGVLNTSGEIAKSEYTIHEMAKMYDARCQYSFELYKKYLKLEKENEELKKNKMSHTKD